MQLCSCGFAYEKQVIGKYYIVGVDTRDDLHLSYQLSSGDYAGRAPGRLLQYGFNDTFLVAITHGYYIIDMTKDSEVAHEENFRIGPLTEEQYQQAWRERLNIPLIDVK